MAKHDQALVSDMKTAIVELYRQSKRREVLYIAIEHNTKYLTTLAQASDLAKNEAMAEIQKLKGEYAKLKIDADEMGRKIKTLSKDSEQLQMERARVTQLTLQVTKSKEKEEQMAVTLKDATKKLQKTETTLNTTK